MASIFSTDDSKAVRLVPLLRATCSITAVVRFFLFRVLFSMDASSARFVQSSNVAQLADYISSTMTAFGALRREQREQREVQGQLRIIFASNFQVGGDLEVVFC